MSTPSTNLQADVPLVNVPFVNADGTVTESWFIFLVQLFRRSGGTSGGGTGITLNDVLALEETFAPVLLPANNSFANEEMFTPLSTQKALLDMIFAPVASTDYAQAAHAVTLGASPAIYRATSKQGFHITGGAVTALTLQRGSVVLPIGNSASDIVDATPTFTAGTSTSVTLPSSFGAVSRLWVFFDAAFQGDDQIASLVGTTLTFTSAIPLGTVKVYVKGLLQSAIGVGSTLIELSPGDLVNVTYSSAPTVTILPR